jgi:hypothetical protein
MPINIGLDIGAISLKLAALGMPEDRPLLDALTAGKRGFRMVGWNSPAGECRPLVISEYRRISGGPLKSTFDLLQELYETVPAERIEGMRATGSGSRVIAKELGVYFENEFKAIARMIGAFYPEVCTVFEIGGESSKFLRLELDRETGLSGIADYDRSGE